MTCSFCTQMRNLEHLLDIVEKLETLPISQVENIMKGAGLSEEVKDCVKNLLINGQGSQTSVLEQIYMDKINKINAYGLVSSSVELMMLGMEFYLIWKVCEELENANYLVEESKKSLIKIETNMTLMKEKLAKVHKKISFFTKNITEKERTSLTLSIKIDCKNLRENIDDISKYLGKLNSK